MRVDAHLEQARDQQEAHAEPCDGFQSFLHGLNKNKLHIGLEGALHGWKDQERNSGETADPCDRGKQVQPERKRQRPRGRSGDHRVGVGAGVSVGGAGVSVGITTGGVSVGTPVTPPVVGVTGRVGATVSVAGKQAI